MRSKSLLRLLNQTATTVAVKPIQKSVKHTNNVIQLQIQLKLFSLFLFQYSVASKITFRLASKIANKFIA